MTILGGLQWSLLVPAASAAIGALMVLAFDAALGRSENDARAMGRHGLPEDTANAVAFLCSDEAAYITAESMNVSGGEEPH